MPLEAYPDYALTIGGAKYLPLIKVCEKENISWDYDANLQTVTLRKKDIKAKLMVGSEVVLAGNNVENLGRRVIFYNGMVAVPYAFEHKVVEKIFREKIAGERQVPLKIKIICLDAGHGGKDPGALGRKYGLREKNINLDIVRRMSKALKAKGVDVVVTRASDIFIPLEKRAEIANKSGSDLFISIHTNASKRRKLSGFEVYYIADNADDAARARELSEEELNFSGGYFGLSGGSPSLKGLSKNLRAILWDLIITRSRYESANLAKHICKAYGRKTDINILGIKGARFVVLKKAVMPSLLIELGFISNAKEEEYLKNGFYRQQIADALVEGILSYNRSIAEVD